MRDHVHYNSNVSLLTILTVHLMLFMETIKCKICKTNVISLHFLKIQLASRDLENICKLAGE